MNPFSSGTPLRDMIRAIRACKTAAEERAVVRKECAAIRASINENDQDYKHRNLAKLMFIHMLGYPTHFGQMECLKLIASAGFPEKRIGYLGLMLLLDERQEVLMLVTNSLKRDLNQSNKYTVGLALCALGNISSAEMARDLAPDVERLLQFRDPNIRKKAALCSIRIIKKVPDLAENFMYPACSLLKEKHQGVLITGVQLCTDLCKVSTEALEYFRENCIGGLVRTLREIANSPYSPEYDVSGITNPFLHIRLLKLLRILGQGDADASDCMTDILAQVASRTETNKNAGNAILYECVETIMSIEDNGGLRVLAINILGRFLSNRDNNIRYVGLNMLMKAIMVDSKAVQRHRATILDCVKDSDASIQKRALELVYLLVNESNVKPLTKELIDYLEVSDQEFKGAITAKICSLVEKFPSEKIWYIDQMLKVLSEAGNFVKDEVWHTLIVVISNASDLHGYTVRALYRAFQASEEQESLVRVAVWCIGEYGDMLVNNVGMLDIEEPITVTESDAVGTIEAAIYCHKSDLTTKAMALIALFKLSSRFPSCSERIKDIIVQNRRTLELELQQRSIEFNCILQKHENIRYALVERMPVLDEATFSGKKGGSLPRAVSTSTIAACNLPNGIAQPAAALIGDLLDLSADDAPTHVSSGGDFLQNLFGVDLYPASASSGTSQPPKAGTDVLMDLLSIGTSAPAQSSSSELAILSSAPSQSSLSALDVVSLTPAQSSSSELAILSSAPSQSSLYALDVVSLTPAQSGLSALAILSSAPAESSSSAVDILSSSQDNKAPIANLNGLASRLSLSANATSTTSAGMMNLFDEIGPIPQKHEENGQAYPSLVAYESSSLRMTFNFSKQPGNPQTTIIQATFTNLSANVYNDFLFQAAVPKFLQLHLDPASSNILPAGGNGSITQSLEVTNTQHGKKSLVMRIRIAYKTNDKDVLEEGQIRNFPREL